MQAGLERIYQRLEAWGYPRAATDWLRRHRLAVILLLAALCWLALFVIGWLLVALFSLL